MVEITVSNVKPEQPLLMQIDVRAPHFADAFSINYPHPASGAHTFKIPVSSDQSGSKEYMIRIGFAGAGVTYTYRP
jgi:hypothetical protein